VSPKKLCAVGLKYLVEVFEELICSFYKQRFRCTLKTRVSLVQAPSHAAAESLTLSRVPPSGLTSLTTLDALSSLRNLRSLSLPYCYLKTLQHLQPCSILTGLTALCVRNNVLAHLQLLPSFVATEFPSVVLLNGQELRRRQRRVDSHAAQSTDLTTSGIDTGPPLAVPAGSSGICQPDGTSVLSSRNAATASSDNALQPYRSIAALVRKWKAGPLARIATAIGSLEADKASESSSGNPRGVIAQAAAYERGNRVTGVQVAGTETVSADQDKASDARRFQQLTDRVVADAIAAEGRLQQLDQCWDGVVAQFLGHSTPPGP
jgi:hypothetical protein